jgi:hypothetical protein
MPDGEDAAVHRVQVRTPQHPGDLVAREAEIRQLPARHDAVLAGGERRHRDQRVMCADFGRVARHNSARVWHGAIVARRNSARVWHGAIVAVPV